MNLVEKILARASGQDAVTAGDVTTVAASAIEGRIADPRAYLKAEETACLSS